jgi:hypothetical protein
MDIKVDGNKMLINGNSVHFPRVPSDYVIMRDTVIAQFSSTAFGESLGGPESDHDIVFEDPNRNIVGLSDNGSQLWLVEPVPEEHRTNEVVAYDSLYKISHRVLCSTSSKDRIYHIDNESGEIVEWWPSSHLPIGEQVVEFEGRVSDVLHYRGILLIKLLDIGSADGDTRPGNVFAVDNQGNRLWQSAVHVNNIRIDNEAIKGRDPMGPRTSMEYTFDPETGDVVDHKEVPDMN